LARVKPFNPGSPTLRNSEAAWLSRPGTSERNRLHMRECRPHRGMFIVGFEGIDSLDDLEPWIGSLVEVELETLAAPEEGELYHHEAMGLEIRTNGGEAIGAVVEVMSLPANDLWVVRERAVAGRTPREWLIPAVAPIVIHIDLRERFALIDPIPGLLES
jgi:16S rRNA processing protein RimM